MTKKCRQYVLMIETRAVANNHAHSIWKKHQMMQPILIINEVL